MIYTTYFSKVKDLPENVIPISICGKAPAGWTGLQYKKLAPKYSFFKVWKETHDDDYYIEHYEEEVLKPLNAKRIVHELYELATKKAYANFGYSMTGEEPPEIALVCYEKPENFCHRHLVSGWFIKNGFESGEFIY